MSQAYRARKKAKRKAARAADKEICLVTNAIKRGKAPRLARLASRYKAGVYRHTPKDNPKQGPQKPGKRAMVVRRGERIKFTLGVILAVQNAATK